MTVECSSTIKLTFKPSCILKKDDFGFCVFLSVQERDIPGNS